MSRATRLVLRAPSSILSRPRVRSIVCIRCDGHGNWCGRVGCHNRRRKSNGMNGRDVTWGVTIAFLLPVVWCKSLSVAKECACEIASRRGLAIYVDF